MRIKHLELRAWEGGEYYRTVIRRGLPYQGMSKTRLWVERRSFSK